MEALIELVRDLSKALKDIDPNYHITFNVAWRPDCIDGRYFDYKSIAESVDYIYITSFSKCEFFNVYILLDVCVYILLYILYFRLLLV